jgi:hypothetical protein
VALQIRTNDTDRMRITETGNVGIGTTTPSNIVTVVRNSTTDPIADAWVTYSSKRWKTNIQTIQEALEKVRQLRGVTYDWKDGGKHDIGLIAEEVGKIVPEIVVYEKNGQDAVSVDYARLVALLIEALKEQDRELRMERDENAAQHAAIDMLLDRLQALEEDVRLLKRGAGEASVGK